MQDICVGGELPWHGPVAMLICQEVLKILSVQLELTLHRRGSFTLCLSNLLLLILKEKKEAKKKLRNTLIIFYCTSTPSACDNNVFMTCIRTSHLAKHFGLPYIIWPLAISLWGRQGECIMPIFQETKHSSEELTRIRVRTRFTQLFSDTNPI